MREILLSVSLQWTGVTRTSTWLEIYIFQEIPVRYTFHSTFYYMNLNIAERTGFSVSFTGAEHKKLLHLKSLSKDRERELLIIGIIQMIFDRFLNAKRE